MKYKLYYNSETGRFGVLQVQPSPAWTLIHNTPEYDKTYHRFIWNHTDKYGRAVRDPSEVIGDWQEFYKNM